MLDAYARPLVNPILRFIGSKLSHLGVKANTLTILGGVMSVFAFVALTQSLFMWALIFILLNQLCDGLDGTVARYQETTDFGCYLDNVFDFILYGLVPLGFAIAMPEHAVAAAVLITSYIGITVSFLAHGIFAEKHGLSTDVYGKKSFYYVGGPIEATETMAFFIVMCIWPHFFPILAYILAFLCVITTITRGIWAYKAFK